MDRIVVYEAEGKGSDRTQKVDIYFNFVGQFDLSPTEEELAEGETAAGAGRDRAPSQTQGKENNPPGEAQRGERQCRQTKVCEYCGSEYAPASNRQKYCSDACWAKAYQEKEGGERLSERAKTPLWAKNVRRLRRAVLADTQPADASSVECRKKRHNEIYVLPIQKKREETSAPDSLEKSRIARQEKKKSRSSNGLVDGAGKEHFQWKLSTRP